MQINSCSSLSLSADGGGGGTGGCGVDLDGNGEPAAGNSMNDLGEVVLLYI